MNHISQRRASHQQCTIKIHANDNPSLCFESGSLCLYVHRLLRCIQGEMLATSRSFIPLTKKKKGGGGDLPAKESETFSILLQIFSNGCQFLVTRRLDRVKLTCFPFQRFIFKQPSLFFLFFLKCAQVMDDFFFCFLFETQREQTKGGERQEDVSIIYR